MQNINLAEVQSPLPGVGKKRLSEEKRLTPCTFARCSAGHTWPLRLRIEKCPGCGQDFIIREVKNCAICNEPSETIEMRIDHLGLGGPINARCKGEIPHGFSGVITIERDKGDEEKSWETQKSTSSNSGDQEPLDSGSGMVGCGSEYESPVLGESNSGMLS